MMTNNLYYDDDQENKLNRLLEVSNPKEVINRLHKYTGDNTMKLYISSRKNNKYMVIDPENDNKFIHFGHIDYEDFTKHKDEDRRSNYLKRTANIRGSWKNNKYSKNNLARVLLWNADF